MWADQRVVLVLTVLWSFVSAKMSFEPVSQALFSSSEYVLFVGLVLLAASSKHGKYYVLTKPLPILFLISKAVSLQQPLILYGLLFGLAGDLLLVVYRKWRPALMLGAMSFFLGHSCYLLAYHEIPLSMGPSFWVSWLGLFLIFMHEYFYYMLNAAPLMEMLFGLCYWTAISLMLLAAANAQHYFWFGFVNSPSGFPFAFLGAFAFVLSDLAVHWVVYVQRDHKGFDKIILPLYYMGQLFIVASAPELARFTV